jgi:hypothetical protein
MTFSARITSQCDEGAHCGVAGERPRETGSTPMTVTTAGMRTMVNRVRAGPDVPGRLFQAHPRGDHVRPGAVRAEPGPGFRAAFVIAAGCVRGTCLCR